MHHSNRYLKYLIPFPEKILGKGIIVIATINNESSLHIKILAAAGKISPSNISIVVTTTNFADFWPEIDDVHELSAPKILLKGVLGALLRIAFHKHAGNILQSVTMSFRIHTINYARNALREYLATPG